jgi:hypothetical protein
VRRGGGCRRMIDETTDKPQERRLRHGRGLGRRATVPGRQGPAMAFVLGTYSACVRGTIFGGTEGLGHEGPQGQEAAGAGGAAGARGGQLLAMHVAHGRPRSQDDRPAARSCRAQTQENKTPGQDGRGEAQGREHRALVSVGIVSNELSR